VLEKYRRSCGKGGLYFSSRARGARAVPRDSGLARGQPRLGCDWGGGRCGTVHRHLPGLWSVHYSNHRNTRFAPHCGCSCVMQAWHTRAEKFRAALWRVPLTPPRPYPVPESPSDARKLPNARRTCCRSIGEACVQLVACWGGFTDITFEDNCGSGRTALWLWQFLNAGTVSIYRAVSRFVRWCSAIY
jgi:hypothetical protein